MIIGGRTCHLHNERKMNLSSEPALSPCRGFKSWSERCGGRGRKAKASPILVRFKSLLRWSKGKLRNGKLERIAQGPTAAKGQSWLESLAVPTQRPINAGKMDLMGFMSQKLKETWQTVWSKASSISQMWKSSPAEGQGPAKSTQ